MPTGQQYGIRSLSRRHEELHATLVPNRPYVSCSVKVIYRLEPLPIENPTPKFGYNVASFRLVGQTTIAPMCRISRESMARWHRGGAACAIRNPESVDQRVQGPRSSRSALDCQHHCRSQDQATYQECHHGIFVAQCGPMVTGPRPMCRISWQRTSCGTTLAGPVATCAA